MGPTRVIFADGNGNEVELSDFYDIKDEPDFLIPKKLDVGEMKPILWREDLSPVDGSDGESFVIGFPPELHEEFTKYVANSGMMKIAHQILYKEEPLEQGDQRIYTLDDGEKWTAMVQGSWDTDMVWLDQGDDYQGRLRLDPNVGVIQGGESRHGTVECNYRKEEEFRLSFAVYVADVNERNIDMIASDSTSLWPTMGDTFFIRAQKGRLWSKNGKKSIKHDSGRLPMNIQDKVKACATMDKVLCMTDLQGMRLRCPKTCELYLEDDVYYAKYFPKSDMAPNQNPTCDDNNDSACAEQTATTA